MPSVLITSTNKSSILATSMLITVGYWFLDLVPKFVLMARSVRNRTQQFNFNDAVLVDG